MATFGFDETAPQQKNKWKTLQEAREAARPTTANSNLAQTNIKRDDVANFNV